jgi:diadenosine tetraphosphate (Ap4A) HIT family hydrolase
MEKIQIYEDSVCNVFLSSAAKGHMKIVSKKYKATKEIPDEIFSHMFFISNFAATCAFEKLGSQGTNIIANNEDEFFAIDIIPRSENDSIKFNWDLKPGNPGELDSLASKIKDEMDILNYKEKEKKEDKKENSNEKQDIKKEEGLISDMPCVPKEFLDEEKELSKNNEKEKNYLLSELRRIP